MHRSGTSALTGALGLGGMALPAHLMPATDANPRGYFESQRLYELHEEILAVMGTSWFDLSPPPASFMRAPESIRWAERLVEAVEDEFGEAECFILKDPRMCRLVPLWMRVFELLRAEPLWILMVRNPLEVTASLRREQEIGEQRGALLWLDHVLRSERDTRGQRRVVISYESLLEDWRRAFRRIEREFGIGFPRLSRAAEANIDAFLSPSLRRQRASLADLELRDDMSEWVKQVMAWAHTANADDPWQESSLDAIGAALGNAELAFGPVVAALEDARSLWQREAENRQTALADRDEQIDRLLRWVETMIEWAAQTAAAAPVPRDALSQALSALKGAGLRDPAAAAGNALQHAGLAAAVVSRDGQIERQRTQIEEIEAVRREQRALLERSESVRTEQRALIMRLEEARLSQSQRLQELYEKVEGQSQRIRELEAKLEAERGTVETLDREAACWLVEIEVSKAQIARKFDRQSQELEALRASLEEASAALAEARREVDRQGTEILAVSAIAEAHGAAWAEARAEVADRLLQIEQLVDRLTRIESSLSWRMTRPLRAFSDLAGR